MAIGEVPLDMRFYRYMVESLDLLFYGQPDPIKIETGTISSLTMEKDFDEDFFPVFRVSLMLDVKLYNQIRANKESVKFRFRFQKYVYDQNKNLKVKKDVFNEIFVMFLDDNTPFLHQKTFEATQKVIGSEKQPSNVGGQEYVFYLFKEKDILNSSNIMNFVADGASMMDIVSYSLSESGFTKVLMTPFDNKAPQKEVLVPPLPLIGSLEYLENQYGFHKLGSTIFFDFDRTYIIDKNPKCTAWATEEYKNTVLHIKLSTNADSLSPGSYDNADEKTYYINVIPDSIVTNNPSIIMDLTDGNNIISVIPSTGEVTKIEPFTVQRGKGSYKYLVNKYGNPFAVSAEKHRREEASRLIHMNIADFDIDAFSPNKEFRLIYEDAFINKWHGGRYRLSKIIFSFANLGEELSIAGSALFKRSDEYGF